MDTNELFLDNTVQCTFIEPYPNRLKSNLKEKDYDSVNIIEKLSQDVPLDTFTQLQANDILLVDSTHVSKLNSDVNYIIHEIFPILNSGVYIHVHDIFYPFEYPKRWFEEGMVTISFVT